MDMLNANRRAVAIAAVFAFLVLVGGYFALRPGPAQQEAPAAEPGVVADKDLARLGIRLEPARAAAAVPLASVPATVSLPPEARVAVTSPFAGTAVRVLVIQGERVARGQPLAVVRAAQTVQFGAELARAEADLAFARANAQRLEQLAREGVIAAVRADEATASLRRTEATIRENRRLLALGGAGGDGTVTLRAPISGRVATVGVETGGAVGADGPAPFVVENDSALTLDLQIPERLLGQVRPGMPVAVYPADGAQGPAAAGRILSVGASLDPLTRSLPAKASLAPAPGLVAGKGVMAVISADAGARPGVTVRVAAVTRIEGQPFVFVRSGTRFVRRKVAVAAEVGSTAVVTDGLRAGEPVAVSGVAELKMLLAEQ